jgi:ubiquinone/menaquinone biosynthesis C-methylase UbiE
MIDSFFTYQCPHCQGGIEKSESRWHCKNCGRDFDVYRGVPVLDIGIKAAGVGNDNLPLWKKSPSSGSLGVENPDEFLNEVEENGWRTALGKLLGSTSGAMLRAVAPNRVSWKYLLDIDSSWKALDIGAGTGGVACQLAKDCSVIALEKTPGAAAFMHHRGQQEKLNRFEAVAADAVALPLKSDQFDLVCMIGSLEWMPFGWPEQPPRETQLRALREAYRVLKPGGNFYLGIENALYLGYYLGILEPHTNMKYVSLLEKEKAEQLSRDVRGRSYLELTHSKDDMIALLKEAGFTDIRPFWIHPDYAFTNYFIPLDKPNMIKYFIEENLNPWDFSGPRAPVYKFFRLLDPAVVADHVEFFGFLARRPGGVRK